MAPAKQLNVTLTSAAGGATVIVPISAALRDPSQSGLNAADVTLDTILKRGYFWVGATAYTVYDIASVTYS